MLRRCLSHSSSVLILIFYLIFDQFIYVGAAARDKPDALFSEQLWLQNVAGSSHTVAAHLTFQASTTSQQQQHSATFPRAILDLITLYDIQSLHLSLTRGHWTWTSSSSSPSFNDNDNIWVPPPPGLELTVHLSNNTLNSAAGNTLTHTHTHTLLDSDERLQALLHALGGLTSSAVGSALQHGIVTTPTVGWFSTFNNMNQKSMTATTSSSSSSSKNSNIVYIALPQESIGATSLTSWIKLLPCRNQRGLASLLQHNRILAAPYHTLTLDIHQDRQKNRVDLTVGVSWVTGSPPLPSTSSSSSHVGVAVSSSSSSSLSEVFKSVLGLETVPVVCQVVKESTVLLPTDTQQQHHQQRQQQRQYYSEIEELTAHSVVTLGNALHSTLDITAHLQLHHLTSSSSSSTIAGGGRGVLVHIMQLLPWELKPHWHTLQLTVNNHQLQFSGSTSTSSSSREEEEEGDSGVVGKVVWHKLVPEIPRKRAAHIELLLQLNNGETQVGGEGDGEGGVFSIQLQIEFTKRLLTIFDYPPDASRGIDIPAALITAVPSPSCNNNNNHPTTSSQQQKHTPQKQEQGCTSGGGGVYQARTQPQIVNLPIPDASMPFNVVCFTSTALAMLFGATITPALLPLNEYLTPRSLKTGLKQRLQRLVATVLLVGGLAMYLDPGLQRKVEEWLVSVGITF